MPPESLDTPTEPTLYPSELAAHFDNPRVAGVFDSSEQDGEALFVG